LGCFLPEHVIDTPRSGQLFQLHAKQVSMERVLLCATECNSPEYTAARIGGETTVAGPACRATDAPLVLMVVVVLVHSLIRSCPCQLF
jgi:hypothetical protein